MADIRLYVTTAEDTLLPKRQWYRQSGEVSQRQWRDILGVLRVQQGRPEMPHSREWAARLGVTILPNRALVDAAL